MLARLPASVQVEDLIQAGMLGLLEAARKFDHGKGASFETYAGIRIRGAMLDDVRKGDWAPRSVHPNTRPVSSAIRAVEARVGRDAKDHEVAAELDMSLEEYHAILGDTARSRLLSFDERPAAGAGGGAEAEASRSGGLEDARSGEALAEASDKRPGRARLILSPYYGEEFPPKEIGAVLGVSESRVRQLHSQCAARLRARMA